MRIAARILLPLFFVLAAPRAFAEDADKMKAPDLLKKAAAKLAEESSYAFDASTQVLGQGFAGKGTHTKPDFWHFQGDQNVEVYLKGKRCVAKNPANGAWVDPKELDPNAGMLVGMVQTATPNALLDSAVRNGKNAKLLDDEKVGGADCKVIEVPGTQEDIRRVLLDQAKQIPMLKGMNPEGLFDMKASTSVYKVWVGKGDLLIQRVETHVHVEPKKGGAMPIPPVDQTLTVDLSEHGQDHPIEAPDDVKKKLGIK